MTEKPRTAAVLLAAGPSSRLGRPKQLQELGGECLVRRTARLLLELGLTEVAVVVGCERERVEQELEGMDVTVVHNAAWQKGMGGSIACGVRSLPKGVDGVLLMVCDQWRIELEDLSRLLERWLSDISSICVASWKEGKAFVSGPPVVFPRNLIPELKFLIENRGARQVIDRHMETVEFVKMENAAFDLDRPEDLEKMASDNGPYPSS